MAIEEFKKHIQEIIAKAQRLCAAKTHESATPVNYACIFSQSIGEYQESVGLACRLGAVVQDTKMGPVFHITPIATAAGDLELLKIRRPDPKREEMGDADFTLSDCESFKKKYLGKPGFSLIKRPDMEMIELMDSSYNAIAYFSHPTLATVLKINQKSK